MGHMGRTAIGALEQILPRLDQDDGRRHVEDSTGLPNEVMPDWRMVIAGVHEHNAALNQWM
jgi:hypothetical protein